AHFPAGLVIYWSWSNTLSLLQQYVLMKKEGVEIHFFKRSREDKAMADAVAHGPTIHPELEVIEHNAEDVVKTISPPKKGKKGR
ncbi:MAG TPA: membrane protein insertase YidC, partial [Alphaproteobacteria bacterium]